MEKAALIRVTDVETLKRRYQEVLGDRVYSNGTHPLYNKGVIDGMEIMLTALSESMQKRKRLEVDESSDK